MQQLLPFCSNNRSAANCCLKPMFGKSVNVERTDSCFRACEALARSRMVFPLERERPKPHFPLHMRPRQKWQPADAFSETFGGGAQKTERFHSSPCISCNLSGGIYTREIMTQIPPTCLISPFLHLRSHAGKRREFRDATHLGFARNNSNNIHARRRQQFLSCSSPFSHHQGR